ncbi:28417_t:CDS:2, partial [Gigaspora margarita]
QGQRKESSNLKNTSLNTNNNLDKAAKTIKESRNSRKTNSKGEEGKNFQEKEQEIIEKNTNENNPTKDQEISNKIEAGFTIVTYKKRNTRSVTGIGSSNERHKLYKKDKGGGGCSTSKKKEEDYIYTANHSGHPFTIYTQKTRNNQLMATRLDYIFVDNDHIQFCQDTQTLFGNSDHLLVKSTFNMQSQAQYASYWKFNTKCLMNENIKKGIEEELQGHITIDTWNTNKRIAELQEEVIRYSEREELKIVIEQLQKDLQEELTSLAER